MRLSRDFRELLECFARHEVRFLIVGGWALAAHGHPRMTKDLDIWIWADSANAVAVIEALEDFGFGDLDLSAEDFLESDMVVQLGYPPNRVDLLTAPAGVVFESCWADRLDVTMGGLDVPFIGLEGLKQNKRSSGRPQDLVDIQILEGRDKPLR